MKLNKRPGQKYLLCNQFAIVFFTTACCLLFLSNKSFSQNQKVKPVHNGIAVIELFTSQGDINCPAADAVFSEIIAESAKDGLPVYGIGMHVDFWNRYGWKDPFSSFKYTNRLKNYSSVFGDMEIYTPFMVINGTTKATASDIKNVKDIIAKEIKSSSVYNPEISYSIFDDTLDIVYDLKASLTKNKAGSDLYFNVAVTESNLVTKVLKGDNTGKNLRNDHVSRLFNVSDLSDSKGVKRIPLKGLKPSANKKLIVFVQDKRSRKILGASAVDFSIK